MARTTMDARRLMRALLRSRKFNGMLSLGLRLMGRLGSCSGVGVDSIFEDSFEGVGDFDVG